MTELELQELSKAVAAKYGIAPYIVKTITVKSGIKTQFRECDAIYWNPLWLHNDSGRCFDLAVENGVYYHIMPDNKCVVAECLYLVDCFPEEYADHNNNKQQAARVAVLRALLAKGE